MHRPDRVLILGVPVDAVSHEGALSYAAAKIAAGGPAESIIAINPEKVYATRANPVIRRSVDQAGLLLPDGIGIVMALRLLRGLHLKRVAGADFMQALCARAAEKGWRIFLYGSSEAVSQAAADELLRRHPSLLIAGRSNGFVAEHDMASLIDRINTSGADILFVALGSPKQEEWLLRYAPQLKISLCQGIGGTLDTIAGTVRRAPVFFQKLNLEWFYRLVRQPSRAGRQKVLLYFMRDVLKAKLWPGRAATTPSSPASSTPS